MTALYAMSDVVAATGGAPANLAADAVRAISIDSREITPGALFVAIKGETFDGHDFVGQAIEAGAVAALVSRDRIGGLEGLPLIVVDDALDALYALARFNRKRSAARIVAVTGSVGKTSTKEAIRVALEASGTTHASIKSFNNHWGVPLMLARMPLDSQYGIFEIGMSSAGEIEPLSRLVAPHVAVITTVAAAHLEFFPSVEAIADAKAEIFAGVEPGGVAILGSDHGHVARLSEAARGLGLETRTYGFAEADVSISHYLGADGEGSAEVAGLSGVGQIRVATPGRHTLANAVAALMVVEQLGADLTKASSALARHGAPEGRGAAFALGDRDRPITLIDESYNANPASMRAALDVFSQLPTGAGRKILILGDMRELGSASPAYHADLRDVVIGAKPDMVFLVGAEMEALGAALPPRIVAGQSQRVDEIAQRVLEALAPGDSVMIKGSNGLRLGTLVARIRAEYGAPS